MGKGKRMATKQRKKTASSAKRSAPRKRRAKQPETKNNSVGAAIVLLMLSIFSALGYFRVDGILIRYLVALEAGLVGWGYWILPPMMLLLCCLLLFSGGPAYRARCVCAALLPLLFGAFVHTLAGNMTMDVAALWNAGPYEAGGGLLGGLVAYGLARLLSRVGAFLVLGILLVLCLLVEANVKLSSLAESAIKRMEAGRGRRRRQAEGLEERQRYEEDDMMGIETPAPKRKREKKRFFSRRKPRREADLPIDDMGRARPEPDFMSQEETYPMMEDMIPADQVPIRQTKKEKLFNKQIGVSTPAEYLKKQLEKDRGGDETPKEKPVKPGETPAKPARKPKRFADAAYRYPPADKLNKGGGVNAVDAASELNQTEKLLADTVESFGIEATVVGRTRGPSVTRYELRLPPGIKLAKLTNLAGDIAMRLGVVNVRIAPITGKNAVVGVEVPNRLVTPVPIRSVIESKEFKSSRSPVSFAVGKDIAGRCVVGDISTLPHLLIAGTTGSGKSVCTNSLIISLLYKSSPEEVRFIMVDPKKVELEVYNGIPHLLIPVVTDPKKAAGALQWAVFEMMRRYEKMADWHVRDMESYNKAVQADVESGEEPLPRLVVIIDELADLMLVAAKEVEESICRLAQMGRACGIHLVIATQRPSANVITGLMKANIPSRIAFAVASQLESRIILDSSGAEKLVGKGDMLFAPLGKTKKRVQGCLITEEEVGAVVSFIKAHNNQVQYSEDILRQVEENARKNEKNNGKASAMNVTMPEANPYGRDTEDDRDEHFYEAVDLVVEAGLASTSMLQRRLKLGYARAGRLMDQLEEYGYVGPSEGSKPRKVLISKEKWQEKKTQLTDGSLDAAYERARAMSAAFEEEQPPFKPD